jgi:hypothetical protein
MNSAAEMDLVRLSAANMSDEDWLMAINHRWTGNNSGVVGASSLGRDSLESRILAILLLEDQTQPLTYARAGDEKVPATPGQLRRSPIQYRGPAPRRPARSSGLES